MSSKQFTVHIRRDNCKCAEPEPHSFRLVGRDGLQACLRCFRWIGHPVHVCLACNQKIMPYEAEIQVKSRRRVSPPDVVLDGHPHGRWLPSARYRHELDADCQAALQKTRHITPPWPRRHGANRAEWQQKLRNYQ